MAAKKKGTTKATARRAARPVRKAKVAARKAAKPVRRAKAKKVSALPKNFRTITPSLVVSDAAGAIEFYKRAFGAKELTRMPAPDGKSIWHAELKIGDSLIALHDEMPGTGAQAPGEGRPPTSSLMIYVPKADALFERAIQAGAEVTMPMADMFWGDRMGGLVDPFGHRWSIGVHIKDLTPKQMRQANEAMRQQFTQQTP